MASVIKTNDYVFGSFYDLRSGKAVVIPGVKADTCPAYSGEECSYYDGLCPYSGNTIECQSKEEYSGLSW
jgi:hypothetical protein